MNSIGSRQYNSDVLREDGAWSNLWLALWRFTFVSALIVFPRSVTLCVICLGLHELGHYAAFRGFRIRVYDVCIGVGPRLFECTDTSGTSWTLCLIPIVGYVQADDDGFSRSAVWKQITCIIAGPFVNLCCIVVPVLLSCMCHNYSFSESISKLTHATTIIFTNVTMSTVSISNTQDFSLLLYGNFVVWLENNPTAVGFLVIHTAMLIQNMVPIPPYDAGSIIAIVARTLLPSRLKPFVNWTVVVCAVFLLIKIAVGTLLSLINLRFQ